MLLQDVANQIKGKCLCALGEFSIEAVLTGIERFPADFEAVTANPIHKTFIVDMPMEKLVSLTIDGIQVTVPAGTLIVNAAKKIGIDIPVFCYHPKMEPVGMCRQCLVEVGRPVIDRSTGQPVLEADGTPKIQFGPKLETACTTPVSEGMVVIGTSEKAVRGPQGYPRVPAHLAPIGLSRV